MGWLYKKDLNEPDYYNGVVSHPRSDIVECKVKWTLGSTAVNKAGGCNGIPAKLFKILKDDAVKVLHSICQQIWKTQQWPQDWKRSVFISIPEKGQRIFKLPYNCTHFTYRKIMFKILQASLQQYVNWELPDVQAGFWKDRGTGDQIASIWLDHRKSKGSPEKHLLLLHWLC